MALDRERDLVLGYVQTVHAHPDEGNDEIVQRLVGTGVSELDARLLEVFVPEAFARVDLAQKGLAFTRVVGVESATSGRVWIPLARVPIYQAALSVARDAFQTGSLSREVYVHVSRRSAKYDDYLLASRRDAIHDAAVKALRDGTSPRGTLSMSEALTHLADIAEYGDASYWRELSTFTAPGILAENLDTRARKSLRERLWARLDRREDLGRADPSDFDVGETDLRPNEPVNAFLRDAFASHGVESSEEGGWLIFSREGISANGALFAMPSQANPAGLQMDVRILIEPEDVMIVESFGGVGYTREEALQYAYTGFVQSSLHVLLAALFGHGEEQVTREEWMVGGLPRIATFGDVTIRMMIRANAEAPAGPEASAWFGELEREIKAADLGSGIHWIRVFYAQEHRRMQCCEVVLDNEPWEPVQDRMAKAPWPTRDDGFSIRLFLILQDKQEAAPDSP